jgi:large subunit ribosomal protein L21
VVTAKLPIKVGTVINLEKVLLVGSDSWTAIGTPLVPTETARVTALVYDHHRGAKLQVFKKTKRKGYTRKKGVCVYVCVRARVCE